MPEHIIQLPELGSELGRGANRVVEILVKPGDLVQSEQHVFTVETDVAILEIPSFQAGVVENIFVSLGQSIEVGAPLLSISTEAIDALPATQSDRTKEDANQQTTRPSSYAGPTRSFDNKPMILTWIIRIVVLVGSFALHWGFGIFMLIGLFFHMQNKANAYNRRFNLGGKILGPNGRPIRAPWYIF